ncbi:MAG TPA: carbohydrate ABC transporter permease [Clostridiales bacterium]|nr:carbohydrate ABC transporter permease [Clostridiales bacterium]
MRKKRGNPNRIKLSKNDFIYQIIIHAIVGLVTLACLFPFIYVVGMSLTSQGEMVEKSYFVLFPERPTLRGYQMILRQPNFFNSLLVSVSRTILGTMASLVLVIPGGYILSKQDLPGRKALMMFFIITMILSGGLIPSYMLMKELRLLDTFWVYIIPAMGGTFNMLIIKLFVENMPDSIMESADLDGATEMQKMLYIAMPLLVPTIAALSLFAAVGQWNSWFDAMLYIQNAKLHPLSLVVRNLMFSATIQDKSGNLTMYEKATTEGMKMATIVLAAIPILCVYPFLQKYFIYGVYTGSVKG